MSNSIIAEGKTSTEAIENGLKQLKVSKDKVDIKILEDENKKSFFSILNPRTVRVELTLKENVKTDSKNEERKVEVVKKEYNSNIAEIEEGKDLVEKFLKDFLNKIDNSIKYEVKIEDNTILVDINGEECGNLIGYRGDTLNSIQTILSAIANKKVKDRIKVIVDIENYREKREKTLEDLAEKYARSVLKYGKNKTLEPMSAYERKIIHTKLQNHPKIETYSIGEGENRRIVIAKK